MKIIKTNRELAKKELFAMTMGKSSRPMRAAQGSTLEIDAYCIYEDVNSNGDDVRLLSIKTVDDEVFTTNSQTFIRDFERMTDMFAPDPVNAITVVTGTTKAGRTFITCDYAGD